MTPRVMLLFYARAFHATLICALMPMLDVDIFMLCHTLYADIADAAYAPCLMISTFSYRYASEGVIITRAARQLRHIDETDIGCSCRGRRCSCERYDAAAIVLMISAICFDAAFAYMLRLSKVNVFTRRLFFMPLGYNTPPTLLH